MHGFGDHFEGLIDKSTEVAERRAEAFSPSEGDDSGGDRLLQERGNHRLLDVFSERLGERVRFGLRAEEPLREAGGNGSGRGVAGEGEIRR